MDERRLHFPIHGTRLSGDGDPARGVGEAARLLYFVNLIAQTAGVPVFQLSRQTPYGMVAASVHGPLAFKSVLANEEPEEEDQEEETTASRLVWLPEGFVITPRTPGAPDGFGMPPTPDGRGTPAGPLRQVIINRFKDNQYPDAVYRAAGGGEGRAVFAANLFFMDWEMTDYEFGVGIYDASGRMNSPQFKKRWVPQYREPDSGSWHCHRPQHHLYETALEALIRTETNLLREQAGLAPLSPPLRGTTGELTQNIAYQMRWSGAYAHNSPRYREGHRTFDMRFYSRSGFNAVGGENLNFKLPASVDEATAHGFVDSWRTSPGHYANMITDWHRNGAFYAYIDTAITESGKVSAGSSGALGVQIFHSSPAFVVSNEGVHSKRPPVTVDNASAMFLRIYRDRFALSGNKDLQSYVTYRGRRIDIAEGSMLVNAFEVLSGTTVVKDGAETKLRVAALVRPNELAGQVFFAIYEGDVHDFLATRQEIVRYPLPMADADQISIPVWSESGKKMAFCVTTLSPVPPGRITRLASEPLPTTFVGQQLRFLEFAGSGLVDKGTDRLQIDATDFSPTHRRSFCKGTVRLLPVYSGETLSYVSVEVNSSVYFSTTRFEKRVYGALVFPGGTRLVYADQSASDGAGAHTPVKGFVRHILPFDVSDPSSVAYIQYDHPEKPTDLGISARLVIRGTEVKHSPLAYSSGFAGPHYRNNWAFEGTEYTLDSYRGNPYYDPFFSEGLSFFGSIGDKYTPSIVFDGVVVGDANICPPSGLVIGPPGTYTGPVSTSPSDTSYVLLGPTLLRDGVPRYGRLYEDSPSTEKLFPRVEQFRYCKYKDDWLYAGRVENTLGGTGEFSTPWDGQGGTKVYKRGAWLGDDQYYCHSSLDLKAITGLPDLKDNILPIGVI